MELKEQIKEILTESLAREFEAEHNCDNILAELHKNGFSEIMKKIKNDEAKHQQITKELILLLENAEV